jgi:hypothetical protein
MHHRRGAAPPSGNPPVVAEALARSLASESDLADPPATPVPGIQMDTPTAPCTCGDRLNHADLRQGGGSNAPPEAPLGTATIGSTMRAREHGYRFFF